MNYDDFSKKFSYKNQQPGLVNSKISAFLSTSFYYHSLVFFYIASFFHFLYQHFRLPFNPFPSTLFCLLIFFSFLYSTFSSSLHVSFFTSSILLASFYVSLFFPAILPRQTRKKRRILRRFRQPNVSAKYYHNRIQ